MTLSMIRTPLLSERTTLRLGGPARAELAARSDGELDMLARALEELGGRPFAIGAGSNLLAAGGERDLLLVRAENAADPQLIRQADGAVLVRAAAGLSLPRLLGICRQLGLSGLEPLTGVPGKVGGAVAMHAGSYGTETAALLARVRLWMPGFGLIWREAEECSFGYRRFDAGLGGGFSLVWEAEYVLTPDEPAAIQARMEAVYAKKKASQPVTAKSAGCVFKNPKNAPEGLSAGRMLDQAGMRGRVLGGMAFSPMHANFLVNQGGGTAAQALELLELGRSAVRERVGVDLETEVVVLK